MPHTKLPRMNQRMIMMSRDGLTIVATLTVLLIFVSLSECMKRTQYHEQGVHGKHSYKFGFTSGDHKNPQERHEVSDKKGHVKGWYSYKDPHGKMMVFHYEAHPKKGFKVKKFKKHHHHHAAAASAASPTAAQAPSSLKTISSGEYSQPAKSLPSAHNKLGLASNAVNIVTKASSSARPTQLLLP